MPLRVFGGARQRRTWAAQLCKHESKGRECTFLSDVRHAQGLGTGDEEVEEGRAVLGLPQEGLVASVALRGPGMLVDEEAVSGASTPIPSSYTAHPCTHL
jgi:hypothetical protein